MKNLIKFPENNKMTENRREKRTFKEEARKSDI